MHSLATDLRHALDPVAFAIEALGLSPDPWQRAVLRSRGRRLLLNCSRQSGKSTIAAVLALHCAVFFPGSLVLLVSPSLRQSGELFRKVTDLLARLVDAPERTEDSRLSFMLANGSRVVSLPSSETTVRGFSRVALIIEDEAAWVPDELYVALRPMLAVSGGRLVLMSTPFGCRGHFHGAWTDERASWERFQITAREVPRISSAFLDEERRTLGPWRFAQEYLCEFVATVDQLFTYEHVAAAIAPAVSPLGVGTTAGPFFVGVDLGQAVDHTAIVVVERTSASNGVEVRARRPFIVDDDRPRSARPSLAAFHVRHAERVPLGTPYPRIVERVADLLRSPPLDARASVAVDATGVGRAVVDLFHAARVYPTRVTITAAAAATEAAGDHRVPKRDLVAGLQVLLHERRLKLAEALPARATLVDELLAFRATIDASSGRDSYAAQGAGAHDDLVIALALAVWLARAETVAGVPVVAVPEPRDVEDDDDGWNDWPWPLDVVERGSSRYLPGASGAPTLDSWRRRSVLR